MRTILLVWGNWGPYHYARLEGFRRVAEPRGFSVEGLQLFSRSGTYDWEAPPKNIQVHRLDIGDNETRFHPARMARHALPLLMRMRPAVTFVPSYWHWSLFINAASRMAGSRVVMMNESHAGTEKARGMKRRLKREIVRRFDAAFVGGSPHRRHFAQLGLPESRIFTGYDAVDNQRFAAAAALARKHPGATRQRLRLPNRYFLSLGRMVDKKNLAVLVEAYARWAASASQPRQHLVFVGSGDDEPGLRHACLSLGLPVVDQTRDGDGPPWNPAAPAVHFYGHRSIEENPSFYGLADAFILPSRVEEWGLVVNEAMACGLPIIVSRSAGCAEDLVRHGDNGFIIDPSNPRELAARLADLADHDHQREVMGRRSAERIQGWDLDNFGRNALLAACAALGPSALRPRFKTASAEASVQS
jgi:1,2-diacylglycerol 3-alpha-glucosyltransferase